MRRRRLLALLAITVLTAGLGVGCGSDDESPAASAETTAGQATSSSADTTISSAPPTTPASVTLAGETVTTARLLAIADGLCEALRQAPTDVAAAKTTFNRRSHDGLHLIARGLETVDRAAAATLLEAKQKVEADFSRSATASQVAADLRTLADVTRSSLAHFGVNAPACPAS